MALYSILAWDVWSGVCTNSLCNFKYFKSLQPLSDSYKYRRKQLPDRVEFHYLVGYGSKAQDNH